jgi:surfactin synthase thioesterase subunit
LVQKILTSFGERAGRRALVCIAHAGAGAAPFSGWAKPLADIATVWAARLPGREARILEPPLTSVAEMASELTAAVAELDADEIAFFGHCAGAIIAYECIYQLQKSKRVPPVALVVSARAAPAEGGDAVWGTRRQPSELAGYLQEAGGTESALLEDSDFLELMGPTLIADFNAVNSYSRPSENPALNTRIIAVAGDGDSSVGEAELSSWRELCLGKFEVRRFEGDHFYFSTVTPELLSFFGSIFY